MELRFLMDRLRKAWPELKSDPLAFAKRAAVDVGNLLSERLGAQDALAGASTALFLVLSVVFFVLLQGAGHHDLHTVNNAEESPVEILTYLLQTPSQIPSDEGSWYRLRRTSGF